MQDKHKVTLYLPPELHRQLKIRAAVDAEPMSAIAERALDFYLTHPLVVDEIETAHGRTHQVYNCPECSSSVVLREGEMITLSQSSVVAEEELSVKHAQNVASSSDQHGEEELVPC